MCSEVTLKFFSFVDTLQQVVFSSDGKRMYFIAAPEKHPVGLYCIPVETDRTGTTSLVSMYLFYCLFVCLFICLLQKIVEN